MVNGNWVMVNGRIYQYIYIWHKIHIIDDIWDVFPRVEKLYKNPENSRSIPKKSTVTTQGKVPQTSYLLVYKPHEDYDYIISIYIPHKAE